MKTKKFGISLLTIGAIVLLGACGKTEESGEIVSESGSETLYTDDSGDEVVEDSTSLKDDGYFKVIVGSRENPKIKDIVSYDTAYSNSDWDNITFDVEHAKIVNVSDYKDSDDTEYKELISLKYKLTTEDTAEKHVTPEKAVLVLNDGTEVDAEVFLDYWDDEVLTSDKHKDGYIHFKVKEENKLADIEQIKVTFKAKDTDSEEVEHTYTIDLPVDSAN